MLAEASRIDEGEAAESEALRKWFDADAEVRRIQSRRRELDFEYLRAVEKRTAERDALIARGVAVCGCCGSPVGDAVDLEDGRCARCNASVRGAL